MGRRRELTKYQAQAIYNGRTKGLVLGNYVVLDKIGRAGMGQVYKVEHRQTKRVAALKTPRPSVSKSPELVQRFQREVETGRPVRRFLTQPAWWWALERCVCGRKLGVVR